MRISALPLAVAAAMSTPTASQAVTYKLSGQVNRAIVLQDDGIDSSVRNVDAESSGTRFRLKGSEDLGEGMKVGFYWEMQTSSVPSDQQNPQGPDVNANGVSDGGQLRQANVWFSGHWGKLTLGQQAGAGDGATEVDLSGTTTSLYHGRTSFTGGMQWRTSGGATIAGGLTAGNTYSDYDAFSRYDAIRYDSPTFGPVVLSASIGNDDRWEIAGRLNTGIAGGNLSTALFYGQDHGLTTTNNSRYGGSASYLFSQGTNVTVAYGRQEQDVSAGVDSDALTLKLGHKWGNHAVAGLYSVAEDVVRGYEDTAYGIAYNLKLPKVGADIYAAYMHVELDTPAGIPSVEDHDVVIFGARVRFD